MNNSFIGYEYQDVTVKRSMVSMLVDAYENFGWELEGAVETLENLTSIDKVILKFKRDRKIRNKAELTRLQRNFDACLEDVNKLENSKMIAPATIAYGTGIIGTAFGIGAVFCGIAAHIVPCVILAIPATVGFVLPYFLYNKFLKKKTKEITPKIDEKYDEIYTICEKANGLLDK